MRDFDYASELCLCLTDRGGGHEISDIFCISHKNMFLYSHLHSTSHVIIVFDPFFPTRRPERNNSAYYKPYIRCRGLTRKEGILRITSDSSLIPYRSKFFCTLLIITLIWGILLLSSIFWLVHWCRSKIRTTKFICTLSLSVQPMTFILIYYAHFFHSTY